MPKKNVDYVVGSIVQAILKNWGQDNLDQTPRIVRWLENIVWAAIDNDLTLPDMLPMLSTAGGMRQQRRALLSKIRNPAVANDLRMLFESSDLQQQNLLEGPANRVRKFFRSLAISNMLSQQRTVLDLQEIMEQGKILLVNLNGQDRISEDNTRLLGILLVTEFFRVAKLRDDKNPNLKPFYLYVDEFPAFLTTDMARILDQTRKYKLFLLLAHQHLAQLQQEDELLFSSVMTNAHTKIVFGGLSKADAELMADELATGYLNLLAVKDEMFSTKVRHVEETRTTVGHTEAVSTGESESRAESRTSGLTHGQSWNRSHGESQAVSESEGTTDTKGHSDGVTVTKGTSQATGRTVGRSTADSHGRVQSTGETFGRGHADHRSRTTTQGQSHSTSHGRSGSTSRQEGWSSSESTGASESTGTSKSATASHGTSASTYASRSGDGWGDTNRHRTTGDGATATRGEAQQESRSENATESHSASETRSGSTTRSEGYSEGRSHMTNSSEAFTDGESDSVSESEHVSRSASRSRTMTDSEGRSETHGRSQSRAESHTDSVSHATTTSRSQTLGSSRTETTGASVSASTSAGTARTNTANRSRSQGRSETVVPFLRPVEYRELTSRTYWTLPELHYMTVAALKNQPVGHAFVKTKGTRPVATRVRYVPPVRFHPTLTPKRLAAFRARVIAAHPQYYLPADEARRRQYERQMAVFGVSLLTEEPPTAETETAMAVAIDTNHDDADSPEGSGSDSDPSEKSGSKEWNPFT